MSINFVKHVNSYEDNRIEFLFVNFDYCDGNDLIAKILHEKLNIIIGGKIDGIFYTIIPLYDGDNIFKLVWHEDVGNYIYSESRDNESIKRMHKLVKIAIYEINKKQFNK